MTTPEDVERARRVSGAETVTLRWECRAPVHRYSFVTHKTSYILCGTEFTLTHLRSFYEAGTCTARCPSCGATLNQRDDGCEVAT